MPSPLSRARAFHRTPHFRRLLKYGSVSLISTGVTQVVLFLTYHVFTVGTAIECNVIATACASVPAYYLNRTWTWGRSGRSDFWREVVPFWTVSFVGLVLSTIAVGVAAHNADRIAHGSLGRALIVNGANLLTYAFIWSGRYIIFNRYLFGEKAAAALIAEEESEHTSVLHQHEVAEPVNPELANSESADPSR